VTALPNQIARLKGALHRSFLKNTKIIGRDKKGPPVGGRMSGGVR
jgi:hypothetical protein